MKKIIGLILLGALGISLLGKAKAKPPIIDEEVVPPVVEPQQYYLVTWHNVRAGQEMFGFFHSEQDAQEYINSYVEFRIGNYSNPQFLGYVPTTYNPILELNRPFYHHESWGTIRTGDLPIE